MTHVGTDASSVHRAKRGVPSPSSARETLIKCPGKGATTESTEDHGGLNQSFLRCGDTSGCFFGRINLPMLVLASASPRRQELLRAAGISFEIQPADVPEVPHPGESPKSFAERVACEKALAVARQRPSDFVLGADTIVIVDHQILGKPRS